ncbi:MAG: glycosyltransferase family 9 protein [Flavobacteriales bacterium]|nr:glycosyltransferase family 9 protein [Flavobacteriales bacterium]
MLHESQLNIKLLEPFGVPMPDNVRELVPCLGLSAPAPSEKVLALLAGDRRRLILHPLLGSGIGWGLVNYAELIRSVDPSRWQVIVTGTNAESERYRTELPLTQPHALDTGGQLRLEELRMLIGSCDAMMAASTGPLHLAAALGKRAIGLFSIRRPMFPARWAPIGPDAHALVFDPARVDCAAGRTCDCITRISVARVVELLQRP